MAAFTGWSDERCGIFISGRWQPFESVYFLNNPSCKMMNLQRIAIASLSLALFGLMAVPNNTQAQQQGAQEQDSLTYESLASALGDLGTQTQTLGQLDAENVRVVDVSEIMTDLDNTQRQRLRKMYENVETEELHDAIENSPTITDALSNETGTQYGASDVVAIDMQDGGQIVAYVDPNNQLGGQGTDDMQQREDEWQDRDTTEAGDVQQRDDQQEDGDPFETGEARQQDPQTYERLHSSLTDMETHTQGLDRTGAEPTDEQQMDEEQTEQRVRVVNVEDITADLDDAQLQRLRRSYQDANTDELRRVVRNNEEINNALQTQGGAQVDADDVVAINAQEQGETVVYVDPNGELKGEGMGDMQQQQEEEWQNRDTTEAGGMEQRDDQQRDDQQQGNQQQDQDRFDTGEAGQQGAETFERLHSAMHEITTQTQALTETSDQRVRVVNVEDVMANIDETQAQRLRRTYENANTDELKRAVENNEAINKALQNNATAQVDASDVVAIDVQERGETVVYVDPSDNLKGEGMGDMQQQEEEWQDQDTSNIGGRQQRDAQQRGRDTTETQEFEQQEAQERDRDTTEAGGFEQQEAQRRDRNTQETGDVQQQGAQQEDPETHESLQSALNDMETHAQALTRTGQDQQMEEQRPDAQSIRVVNVEDITSDLDDTQVQRLRQSYQNAETDMLHRTLENNQDIQDALQSKTDADVDASDVVAVDVRDNGETVVYVDPNGELEGDGTDNF